MMPKKKRIAIMASCIILAIFATSVVLGYLYLNTDTFEAKNKLFAKYLMQNMDYLELFNIEDLITTGDVYTSNLTAKVEYIENIGTTDENKDNAINKVEFKVDSSIDKNNKYEYRKVALANQEQDLIGFEYANSDDYGIRLNGIRQFIIVDKDVNIDNVNLSSSGIGIDLKSIFTFSDTEKKELYNTYKSVLDTNVSKDKYFKQKKSMLTIDNKDITANAYYIKLTFEEYNNLCIKMLEQLENDEIILSKLDSIEEQIKEIYTNYEPDTSLRESFIELVDKKIEYINDNNIGNSTVKIAVYEKDRKTIRTSIEKTDSNLTIDLHENNCIKIHNTEISDVTEEKKLEISKNDVGMSIKYEESTDSNVSKSIEYNYETELDGDITNKIMTLGIKNDKYGITLTVENKIESLDELPEMLDLSEESIKLSDLNQEQTKMVTEIIKGNIDEQIKNLDFEVGYNNIIKVLQNLNILSVNIETPTEIETTEAEKKSFNSKYEFFESTDLSSEDVKKLLDASTKDLSDIKILLKNNNIENLDKEKLESTSDSTEYIKNISEILLIIKEDSGNNEGNKEKKETAFKLLEKNGSRKYTVSLQYSDNNIIELIRIKTQEDT